MTDEVPLRFKRSTVWPPIVIALVYPFAVLAFMSALGSRGLGWLFDMDTSMGLWFAIFPAVLMGVIVLFPTAMLLFTAISMSKHRLVFGPTDLEWRGIPSPGLRRGRIAYEDIESIAGAGRSVLCIFPRQGKTRFIAIKAYENRTGIILQELRARVDSSRFEPELDGLWRLLPAWIGGALFSRLQPSPSFWEAWSLYSTTLPAGPMSPGRGLSRSLSRATPRPSISARTDRYGCSTGKVTPTGGRHRTTSCTTLAQQAGDHGGFPRQPSSSLTAPIWAAPSGFT